MLQKVVMNCGECAAPVRSVYLQTHMEEAHYGPMELRELEIACQLCAFVVPSDRLATLSIHIRKAHLGERKTKINWEKFTANENSRLSSIIDAMVTSTIHESFAKSAKERKARVTKKKASKMENLGLEEGLLALNSGVRKYMKEETDELKESFMQLSPKSEYTDDADFKFVPHQGAKTPTNKASKTYPRTPPPSKILQEIKEEIPDDELSNYLVPPETPPRKRGLQIRESAKTTDKNVFETSTDDPELEEASLSEPLALQPTLSNFANNSKSLFDSSSVVFRKNLNTQSTIVPQQPPAAETDDSSQKFAEMAKNIERLGRGGLKVSVQQPMIKTLRIKYVPPGLKSMNRPNPVPQNNLDHNPMKRKSPENIINEEVMKPDPEKLRKENNFSKTMKGPKGSHSVIVYPGEKGKQAEQAESAGTENQPSQQGDGTSNVHGDTGESLLNTGNSSKQIIASPWTSLSKLRPGGFTGPQGSRASLPKPHHGERGGSSDSDGPRCNMCRLEFMTHLALQKHVCPIAVASMERTVPVQSELLSCTQCTQKFATDSLRTLHEMNMHGKPDGKPPKRLGPNPDPTKCAICGIKFSSPKNLTSHMDLKHKDSEIPVETNVSVNQEPTQETGKKKDERNGGTKRQKTTSFVIGPRVGPKTTKHQVVA